MSGLLSQQPNTCDPILNNCDDDDGSTGNSAISQNTTSIVSNTTEYLGQRADETTNWPFPIVVNELFDAYLRKYLEDNPKAETIMSNDFQGELTSFQSFTVEGGTGIEVVLHYLDINPLTDFLYFRAGNMLT